ncbi:MAG: hypothetical protein H7Z13_02400 [Ferruginibacter sp.]|nr:hypothetical protein [Ferruginibacter sp.]
MKLFAINKNQAAVITTLLILIFLGAVYFFIYLPHNEKRIQEQHFNALQDIDRNIHTKIENSIALLKNLLTDYLEADEKRKLKLIEYIGAYPSVNFTLTTPVKIYPFKKGSVKDSLAMDSTYPIRVNNDTREISLFFSKRAGKKNDTSVYKIDMKFSFKQFIIFLLPKDVFDHYIVFSKGRPVYESFPAGISYVKEDTLLGAKNGIGSSGIRDQLISGTNYKMFLQPVGFDAKNEWIIAGLLSDKNYRKEKTQLPTQTILLLSTFLLICMVAFPWLKLYQMGSKDRLTVSDGIASIFISMLLVSLIFFIFFNYNHPFRPKLNKDSKIILANGIDKAFKSEIDTVYHKLQQYDKLVALQSENIINLDKDTIAFANGDHSLKNGAETKAISRGITVNQVFWLNKNGDEIINWSADNINGPPGNFKSREYFKRISEQKEYGINTRNGAGRFFLDQVISWTSGTFRSVISMKSVLSRKDSLVVAALSFNFKSLDKVVLPTGFQFAITYNQGTVLYHSEPSRNLNENLLNVFSKGNQLKSCFQAKMPGNFSTKYYGNDYEVEVKPVDGLPYFIVILENEIYSETKETETYSFTFSMLFFLFGFLVLQLFAIFLVSAKRSFFKKQLLDTSWIWPKISCHKEYMLASVFNGIILFLLLLFLNNSSFLEYLIMLLFSVTFIPLFLNILFAKRYSVEKKNVLPFKKLAIYCLCGFIIIIGIIAFKILDLRYFIIYEIIALLLGIALYFMRREVYQGAHQLKVSKIGKVLFARWNYVNSFAVMALTRLIITSGLPVVFFYIHSHNYEENLSIRYKQVDFANRLLDKFPGVPPDTIINGIHNWKGVYFDSSLINSVTVVTKEKALAERGNNPYSKEAVKIIDLLKMFRLYVTDKAIAGDKFYGRGSADNSFFYNDLLAEAGAKGRGTITYMQSSTPGQYLRIQSENLNYHYPSLISKNSFNGALFWLLLATTIFIFYFIISNIIRKLFSLNLPAIEVWKKLDDKILTNKNCDQPLFVISLPGAGKKKYLLDKIHNREIKMEDGTALYFNSDEAPNNVFIAELINIPSSGCSEAEKAKWEEYTATVFDDKNRAIIVNHFEYNIQDSVSNHFKLEFLERLYLENKCKIVILSTIHPVAFLDSAMEQSVKPEEKSVPGQDLERWHVLLGHYRIVVLPLQLRSAHTINAPLHGNIIDKNAGNGIADVHIIIRGTAAKTFTNHKGQFILPELSLPFAIVISLEGYYSREVDINNVDDLNDIELARGSSYTSAHLIRQETSSTYFLKKLQEPAFQTGKTFTEDLRIAKFDELAFKLQVSSHYFYMYIWQSLTKEEKFLMYDLAEDNLVNSFDDYNLSMLMAKGAIIRPDGTLRIFNKGFRNFILTAIGNSEAMKIKNQIKDNGNWNTLKNPLQLVILAILAFLLTSQEEAFAKLITYVAALGAGVPTVLKLFSLFDKNSQKPS